MGTHTKLTDRTSQVTRLTIPTISARTAKGIRAIKPFSRLASQILCGSGITKFCSENINAIPASTCTHQGKAVNHSNIFSPFSFFSPIVWWALPAIFASKVHQTKGYSIRKSSSCSFPFHTTYFSSDCRASTTISTQEDYSTRVLHALLKNRSYSRVSHAMC